MSILGKEQDYFKIAAFDFDHTIIDVNSDIYIDKILVQKYPEIESKRFRYSDEIEDLTKKLNWTHRMNAVFQFMNLNHSIKKQDILSCLQEIKIHDEMVNLIKLLKEKSYELIIVSDANSIFIEEILRQNNLLDYFSTIYTNKADFNQENECLRVQPFNELFNPNGELFNCPTKICSTNICKGSILDHHLTLKKSNGIYNENKHMIYVGDGDFFVCYKNPENVYRKQISGLANF